MIMVMTTEIYDISNESIKKVSDMLKNGKLAAFPTETVYGIGADLFNEEACSKIFTAKNRPMDFPLSAHISELKFVTDLCQDIPDDFYRLAEVFLPGPLTIIMNATDRISKVVSCGKQTIAIRVPDDENFIKLSKEFGAPIAATSANISGKPSPIHHNQVIEDMNGRIDAVLCAGECKLKLDSTVISLIDGKYQILRPGLVTKRMLEMAIGKEFEYINSDLPERNRDIIWCSDVSIVERIDFSNACLVIYGHTLLSAKPNVFALDNHNVFEVLRQCDKFQKIYFLINDSINENVALKHRIEKYFGQIRIKQCKES